MTVKNLDTNKTFHFKNLPGYVTVWKMVNGELVGHVYDADNNLKGTVTFPLFK